MTYLELKNSVLRLLNQKTIAGDEVADTYNNQADYIDRIASLANDCMMEVSTSVRKIQTTMRLCMLPREDLGKQIRYRLPMDFYQFKTGDTLKKIKTDEGVWLHSNTYMLNGRKYLYIPSKEDGDYQITYYRYPHLLDEYPAPDDELDNTPEVQQAIPYYVAALLVVHDDAFLYATFYNKFEDKLARMIPDIAVDVAPVADAYAFGFPGI